MKSFNIMYRVGSAKYLINYHNGEKKHKDGSSFYDVEIFKNKIALNKFVNELLKDNYVRM